MIYRFNITPMGKVRMTQRDKWKPSAQRYFAYIKDLQWQAKINRFVLQNGLHYLFLLPMPDGWTKKKKAEKNGQLHDQTPDLDNLLKALWDGTATQDKAIGWIGSAKKIWAYRGAIVISENY